MTIHFEALPTEAVTQIRTTGRDAYGLAVEHGVSDGDGVPCRHCLRNLAKGTPYMILAHRPFDGQNPYAETGPIFLCAEACARAASSLALPEILSSPSYIVRGYSSAERIVYGTGAVTPTPKIAEHAATLLARPDIAFVDIRSASNNCFQCRVRAA